MERSRYIYFFYKLGILILIVFLLDFSIGKALRYFYFNQKSGKHYRTTYALDEAKTDLLILGSSRANHHYHPGIFENELGISFYNAGRDGNYIFYHFAVLKSVLKRYTPRVVVLDIVRDEFSVDQSSYDRLSSLLPYYHDHPEIRPVIEFRSPYEKIKLLSDIYPYNSALFSILAGNLGVSGRVLSEEKGYVPLDKTLESTSPSETQATERGTDTNKISIYEACIKECISSGVRLFIVCSPYYTPSTDFKTLETARIIAEKYSVPFFDFSYDSLFIDRPDLFADNAHLNDNGAKVFSAAVAQKIKEQISVPNERSRFLGYEVIPY